MPLVCVLGTGLLQSLPVPPETWEPVSAVGIGAVPAPVEDGNGWDPCDGLGSVCQSLSFLGVCCGR